MSNEMKLLRALCEALGFEVVTNVDYQESEMTDSTFSSYSWVGIYGWLRTSGRDFKNDGMGGYARNENGNRITVLKEPVVTYELKKKGE